MLFPLLEPAFAPPPFPSLHPLPCQAVVTSRLVQLRPRQQSSLIHPQHGSWHRAAALHTSTQLTDRKLGKEGGAPGRGGGARSKKPREGGTHRDVELDGLAVFEA